MVHTQQLASVDDIEIKKYYKNKCSVIFGIMLCDVVVNSINDIAGTVNATIGCSEAKDYSKEEVFRYINFCCYSDTK